MWKEFPDFAPSPIAQEFEHEWLDEDNARSWSKRYYPIAKRPKYENLRPALMGITLEPKKSSLLTADNKDEWDYVLRRMFIQTTLPIRVTIK